LQKDVGLDKKAGSSEADGKDAGWLDGTMIGRFVGGNRKMCAETQHPVWCHKWIRLEANVKGQVMYTNGLASECMAYQTVRKTVVGCQAMWKRYEEQRALCLTGRGSRCRYRYSTFVAILEKDLWTPDQTQSVSYLRETLPKGT
jgi:hypothetical protein